MIRNKKYLYQLLVRYDSINRSFSDKISKVIQENHTQEDILDILSELHNLESQEVENLNKSINLYQVIF
jgi:predicted CopG family antitoxin